jgi:hypothetical protein
MNRLQKAQRLLKQSKAKDYYKVGRVSSATRHRQRLTLPCPFRSSASLAMPTQGRSSEPTARRPRRPTPTRAVVRPRWPRSTRPTRCCPTLVSRAIRCGLNLACRLLTSPLSRTPRAQGSLRQRRRPERQCQSGQRRPRRQPLCPPRRQPLRPILPAAGRLPPPGRLQAVAPGIQVQLPVICPSPFSPWRGRGLYVFAFKNSQPMEG